MKRKITIFDQSTDEGNSSILNIFIKSSAVIESDSCQFINSASGTVAYKQQCLSKAFYHIYSLAYIKNWQGYLCCPYLE